MGRKLTSTRSCRLSSSIIKDAACDHTYASSSSSSSSSSPCVIIICLWYVLPYTYLPTYLPTYLHEAYMLSFGMIEEMGIPHQQQTPILHTYIHTYIHKRSHKVRYIHQATIIIIIIIIIILPTYPPYLTIPEQQDLHSGGQFLFQNLTQSWVTFL